MGRSLVLTLALVFASLVPAMAQESKEPSAQYLLSKIDEYKPPVYEEPKENLDYRKIWMNGYLRYLEKRNNLIWEFVKRYPDHERAKGLMEEWYQNLGGGTTPCTDMRIAKAILEIDTLLIHQPPDWVTVTGHYYRAYYQLCFPWNRLIEMDASGVPTDDQARREMIVIGMRVIQEEFTDKHPKDPRGARLMDILATASRDPASARSIYAKVVADYPEHPGIGFYKGKLKRYDTVGEPFEMSFEDAVTGDTVSATDYKGKVLLVVFWTTDIEACKRQIQEVKRLWFRHQSAGLEVVDVSLDPDANKQKYINYVQDYKLAWRHHFQGGGWTGPFSQAWGVNSVPTVFLIDRKGVLREIEAEKGTEEKIKALLKEEG